MSEQKNRPVEIEKISLRDVDVKVSEWPAKAAEGDRKATEAKKFVTLSFYDKKHSNYANVVLSKASLEGLQKEIPKILEHLKK